MMTRVPFGRRQVAEGVRAQVEAVEVAHGHLHPVMPGIVGGGLVPVAVGREARIALQLGDPGQAIRQHRIGRPDQGPAHVPEHLQPAQAAEAGEVVGVARHVREARAVLLEETPSAGRELQHALDPQPDEGIVRELPAGQGMGAGGGEAVEGKEERVVHGGSMSIGRHLGPDFFPQAVLSRPF